MHGVSVQISSDPKATSGVVSDGLRAFNRSFLGDYSGEPIAVDVCDEGGEIIGGAVGVIQLG